MRDILPSIDIAVNQLPQDAIKLLAEAARRLGIFEVEVIQAFTGEEGFDVANIRCLKSELHKDLGIQFIAHNEQKGRVSVEIRASRWEPNDPPTYEMYCNAARQLSKPILQQYNAENREHCRLRIQTKLSMFPKLSPASEKSFNRFVMLANKTGLHPLDWRRFYEFVWHSRGKPLSEDDMMRLLISKGFSNEYASEMASVYWHLCAFKALK